MAERVTISPTLAIFERRAGIKGGTAAQAAAFETMIACGMNPLEVIRAGTLETARFFQVEDRLGTVEIGKKADLILKSGDPSKDLAAMKQIERVLLNRQWIELPE